ncbi:MAG TPA: 16S rRNA (cytosine(1402)-N(4))-methyltransferase RsmH [Aeromicrobium sp.]|nr:16S rRNA (cytosine(1402)-N(4))-methyltransferase RsmH [Aeromicrobium sp.]HKY58526.1 16S rRNA (cytosine(1402)-N(4))-methyltransferase RsmH [Aeromicrobium sp.]
MTASSDGVDSAEARHIPVLLDRVLDLLAPVAEQTNPVIVDATLGLGGHSEAMLERFADLVVIGIDRDPEAIRRSADRLARFGERVVLVNAVYDQIGDAIRDAGVSAVSGVLFDLGVSSLQLDVKERGFAYAQDAPLDMRMNPTSGLSAADVLNTYSERDLARVLWEFGEERFARRIAQAVVKQRERTPFETSAPLVDLIRQSIPAAARRTGGNPAKRTFQALRVEVNDELGAWHRALPAALDATRVGGRVVVLAYHSLEDRYAKRIFAAATSSTAPRDLPVVPAELAPKFKLVTRGAEQATPAEVAANRRAKSVRLRAIERIAA